MKDEEKPTLKEGDRVVFKCKGIDFLYEVIQCGGPEYYLHNRYGNDAIFEALGIEEQEKYVSDFLGYRCGGCFPQVDSLHDLQRVIDKLHEECALVSTGSVKRDLYGITIVDVKTL